MKKSGQFISGCQEGRIIIWKQNNDKTLVSSQIIKEHEGRINCLQINKDESLFITGGEDKLIKFWQMNQNKWDCDQQIVFSDQVRIMSLNNSNTKLITRIQNSFEILLKSQIQNGNKHKKLS